VVDELLLHDLVGAYLAKADGDEDGVGASSALA
jgi:hypothetical protein